MRSRFTRAAALLLIPIGLLTIGVEPAAAPPAHFGVRDPLGMFAAASVEQANRLLAELHRASRWDVLIQTMDHLNGRDLVKTAQQGAREQDVTGIYLLIVRGDKKFWMFVSPEARTVVTPEARQPVIDGLVAAFRHGQFDRGLIDAVKSFSQLLQASPRPPEEAAETAGTPSQAIPLRGGTIEVFFSPNGGCTRAVVQAVATARRQVLVQAYSFTSIPIVKALMAARDRGVQIRIILDRSNETDRYTEADILVEENMPPLIDDKHAIAHNKVMIIDERTVLTGSFNFTKQAEVSNAENLLVIQGVPELARRYVENWNKHEAHSRSYQKKQGRGHGQPVARRRGHSFAAELAP